MSFRPLSRLLPLWVLAGLSLGHTEGGGGGCGDSGHSGHPEAHTRPSGASCPPGEGPTAGTFGRAFLETHCLSCHSASVTGAAREGAPRGVDFDTPEAVRQWASAIDSHSAAGPSAVNTSMPPASRPAPSMDERVRLGQWLSCGAP
jgi:cytochrome c5